MIEALLQAERLLIHGMVDQAEQIYASAAERDPRNSIAVVGLARVALERGDERLAYERACDALAIDRENAAALRLEARLSEVFAARGEPVQRPVSWPRSNSRRPPRPSRPGAERRARCPPFRAARLHAQPVDGRTSAWKTIASGRAKPPPTDAAPPAAWRRPGLWRRLFGDSSDEAKQ